MSKAKKWLARFMAVMMLISVMPTAAFADNEAEAVEQPTDVVIYNLLECEMPVGSDQDLYDAGELSDLFEEDGSYTIQLEDNAFFPYEVQFTYNGETWEEWFMSADDTVEIGEHTFRVASNATDPTALTQLSILVGDESCPVWPEEKEFTSTPQFMPFSMLPLEEDSFRVDMTGYFQEELTNISIYTITNDVELEGDVAVWAKWDYYDENGDLVYENDDYTLITNDATLDLSSNGNWDNDVYLELIVGTVDQLNPDNKRYEVRVYTSYTDELLEAKAYTKDDPRTLIEIYDTYYGEGWSGDDKDVLQLEADATNWSAGEEFYLSLNVDSDFSELDVTVYEGYYETEEDILAAGEAAKDITDQIWNQENLDVEGGYLKDFSYKRYYEGMPEVTVVFERDGSVVKVLPVILYAYEASMSLDYHNWIYAENENGSRINISNSSSSKWVEDYPILTVELDAGYPADGEYYYYMQMYDPSGEKTDIECVEKAVVGYYESADSIPESAVDIKEQLFSNAYSDGGYYADYSKGVTFTVVDILGEIHHAMIKTVEGAKELPSAPEPDSADTYFRMKRAEAVVEEGTSRDGDIESYVMPYDADSYYYNGYQTVFLLDEKYDDELGEYIYVPVTDETIIPEFYTGTAVEMFAGHDGVSGVKQISEETQVAFEHGKAIPYSAAAENGVNLKNYWVTFLTQQSGPKLFVNAANDESRYVTVKDEATGAETSIPQREVFLTEEYNNHHDVFFANVGDEDITGLYVKLENAQNVALDKYWTVGETTSLAAFTTTVAEDVNGDSVDYGDLANFAKIRLVPATDEEGNDLAGVISGTLVIGYTGEEGEPGEEVRIQLTGVAGTPKITTTSILDGVKYVPYSSVIQTNNMYASDAVSFSLTGGQLPAGMSLKANGEIYGVPTVVGEYTFTVTATFKNDGDRSDSKEYTLTIKENTNANVDAANRDAQGYELMDYVGTPTVDANNETYYAVDVTNAPDDGYVFRSVGTYGDFMAFYLDGRELTEGQDYDSEEGSTKITIRAQTFKNAGNGTHTIAAEFRTNAAEDGTMKRSAQNVQVSGVVSSSGGGSSKHSVEADEYVGGTIEVSPKRAAEGKTVTLTVTPDDGYMLKEIDVPGVELTKVSDTEYTFVMPDKKVTISAVFEKVEEEIVDTGLPFIDVAKDDWFFAPVEYVYADSLMIGTSHNTFDPDMFTTRGMVVTILHNMEGMPEVNEKADFEDVVADSYYEDAVAWAAQNGIVEGYGDGCFGPDDAITREQMVTILYQYADYKEWDISARAELDKFVDTDEIDDALFDMLAWAHGAGVIAGTSDTTLEPNAVATRAQTAAMLKNFCEYFKVEENN